MFIGKSVCHKILLMSHRYVRLLTCENLQNHVHKLGHQSVSMGSPVDRPESLSMFNGTATAKVAAVISILTNIPNVIFFIFIPPFFYFYICCVYIFVLIIYFIFSVSNFLKSLYENYQKS